MVDKPKGDINVLAEIAEDKGCGGEDVRIIRAYLKGSPSEVDALAPVLLRVFGPTVDV